ncbi:nucleoside kinase [Schnuerera sp. xch1]|uniref:nucleoside kinase n=1 Tax=Schnuerera sp. xch1 TaxID=2874283 RepID=UPI001CC02E0C|nr:nucleoside kinase [Schnuerera sp. xch1]MBZ2174492.1 nucleoside kinase [Schnuerera sp. xch1]
MTNKIKVYVEGVGEIQVEKGSTLEDILNKALGSEYKNYLGARINNEVYHLRKIAKDGMHIKFLDITEQDGYRIYTRTIAAVFIMACKQLFPEHTVTTEQFLGNGLYAEFENGKSISFSDIEKIKAKMIDIIEKDLPILREKVPFEEGISLFEKYGHHDKIRLYNSLNKNLIQIYRIGDYVDGFHGYLTSSTGYVKLFDLKYYYPGAIILFPTTDSDKKIPKFKEQKKLAKVFDEANEWADILDLGYVSSLNEKILSGTIGETIRVNEAFHEKKIGQIADLICEDEDVNIILIAGPSSSGKTTFAQRLAVHLTVNGKKPITISVDDYFVDRETTPINEDGEYDFECIEAIDLERLNKDLLALLEGKEIELPKFNFLTGKRENSGIKIKVDKDHPIIVEGIHGLNPKLTAHIPDKNKFKIYISALTQLNIDAHNRISTTDTRLIRRMVRDSKFRGNDVFRTFQLWEGVVEGEGINIFPFQEEADVMFNTALVYELAVLKKYAVSLLEKIDNSSIYYSESKRLLKFLKYFQSIEDESTIPANSILREFIGGADINVH